MRKVIFILLVVITVWADDTQKASTIFNMIAKSITQTTNPNIYLHTRVKSLNLYPGELNIITDCSNADLVILSSTKEIPKECKDKILFGTRYSHLKNTQVIGAFFWQKGRPNILFYKKRLDEKNIKLNSSFDKYIEKR